MDDELRANAAWSLGRLGVGNGPVLSALRQAATDLNPEVAATARSALQNLERQVRIGGR